MGKNLKKSFSESIKKAIEAKQAEAEQARKRKQIEDSKVDLRELELSVTVLMVELASSDQNFDQEEYQVICMGLKRLFDTDRSRARELINQANAVLSQMRGTSVFAYQLRDHLSREQRSVVLDMIDELISSDGVEDGFETYHRNRVKAILAD